MASMYFTLPSFARAKKHQQELEKQNPKEPVLKPEDENFLQRQISRDNTADSIDEAEPSVIADDGEVKAASYEDQVDAGQIAIPEVQPSSDDASGDAKTDVSMQTSNTATPAPKMTKKDSFELPSQEEAEAATRGFGVGAREPNQTSDSGGDKRTWASYIPTAMTASFKKDNPSIEPKSPTSASEAGDQRTWAEYASSYVPSLPKLLNMDKDASVDPVLKEDDSIDEEATKAKQEREVSVLLDNLNLSSINNRVFAFSDETQKIYERFALVLKDTMNGGPTAYKDMEKLMKEVGPQLEKQYQSMPPFVQTLVKSLPAKLGATLAPELLAAASEKPGADMKAKQASQASASTSGTTDKQKAQKKKRRIPGLKSLMGKQGAAAGILRNVVSFLRVRFPLLASGTNVIMSLAVFILMFVFWYCHKRGRETRLARQTEAEGPADEGDDGDDFESSGSDDEDEAPADVVKEKVQDLDQARLIDTPLPTGDRKQDAAT